MSENSKRRRILPVIITVLILNAGCSTVDGSTSTTEVTTPKEGTKAGIEQWKCGDYFDGCGSLETDCLTLIANLYNGIGEVRFGEIIETTRFEIQGIERRWDWCLNAEAAYECAFVISVDGTGSYYNFRGSDDGTAKPTDLFKCTKR